MVNLEIAPIRGNKMPSTYTPGSFTKNFSWNNSYKRLHTAVAKGCSDLDPISRKQWRETSKIADTDRQLIPLNFFLYSTQGIDEDFIMIDTFVEAAVERPYSSNFAQLSLFTFHLANSGAWRGSKWPDGRVAGWANDLIFDVAWAKGGWSAAAFRETALNSFLEEKLDADDLLP